VSLRYITLKLLVNTGPDWRKSKIGICVIPFHCLVPVVEPRSGVLIPPTENIKEKSPYFRTSSHLEYGGEGGIDSLCSPLRGSPLTAFAVCPTGSAICRTPVGGSHPPQRRI